MHCDNLEDETGRGTGGKRRRKRERIYVYSRLTWGSPGGSAVKNLPGSQWTACNVGNTHSIHERGRSAGEGNSKSLQYSRLVG